MFTLWYYRGGELGRRDIAQRSLFGAALASQPRIAYGAGFRLKMLYG